jgi:hypothetical protein
VLAAYFSDTSGSTVRKENSVQKVIISELRKNDMVLIVREALVSGPPVERFVRDFTVARVSGVIIEGEAHFWSSWNVRYTDGKPQVEDSSAKLVLPLKNPETKGIYDKITFYRLGKWSEAQEAMLFMGESRA